MKLPVFLKKNLPRRFEHQELVFWIAGVLAFVFCFMQFLIFPTVRQTNRLKEEIATMKRNSEFLSAGGKLSLEEMLVSLRKELSVMEGNLTQKEKSSEVLTVFLKKANGMGIQVVSVRPKTNTPYPDPVSPLRLDGKVCQAFSFEMNLKCSYRTLGSYLESLAKESPFTFTVDGIEIQKEGVTSDLKATLFLTTYLFGTPS